MSRVIILFLLAALLVWVIKRQLTTKKPTQRADKSASEKMLPCSRCGVHVPESETKLVDQKVVCKNPNCQS